MTASRTSSCIRSMARAMVLCCAVLSCQQGIATDDPIAAAISSERLPTDRIQDDWRKPAEVLRFLEVAPGQHALDFFAGPGYYSELLSRVVGPTGSVLIYNDALYTQAAHHDLMVRLSRGRLPNAKLMNQPANYLKLKPESLDRVLFVLVYHDIYWHPRDAAEPLGDAQKVLANLRAALKPNGLVVVVEHVANDTLRSGVTDVANRLHRIDPKIVREDFELAGFEFVGENAALRHPDDDHTRSVFSPTVRHRTDQFIYKFRKP
jgi:predicted methyltransferase